MEKWAGEGRKSLLIKMNNVMKICSISLVFREMQITTKMKYPFTHTRLPIIVLKIYVRENVYKLEYLCFADGNIKWFICYGKQFGGS